MIERLIKLRNTLKLSQAKFAEKISLSSGAMGSIETGFRKLTPRTIKLICFTFGVNKDWLINGEGEMFLNTEDKIFEELTRQYDLDELDRCMLKMFLELPEQQRTMVSMFIKTLKAEYEEQQKMHLGLMD